MKNNQFSPMTEKEMLEVNGGGLPDGGLVLCQWLKNPLSIIQSSLASLGLNLLHLSV